MACKYLGKRYGINDVSKGIELLINKNMNVFLIFNIGCDIENGNEKVRIAYLFVSFLYVLLMCNVYNKYIVQL